MDINAEQAYEINLKKYTEIVLKKTGHYMSLPLTGSAILAQQSEITQNHLAEFGKCIGIAFQIIDDIVDVFEQKGRPIGSDIRSGSKSVLIIHTLNHCSNLEKRKLIKVLQKERKDTFDSEIQWSINLFHKYKAIHFAKDFANRKIKAAQMISEKVSQNLKAPLQQIIEYMKNTLQNLPI